eukprot:3403550-Rhodomonas_salina.2
MEKRDNGVLRQFPGINTNTSNRQGTYNCTQVPVYAYQRWRVCKTLVSALVCPCDSHQIGSTRVPAVRIGIRSVSLLRHNNTGTTDSQCHGKTKIAFRGSVLRRNIFFSAGPFRYPLLEAPSAVVAVGQCGVGAYMLYRASVRRGSPPTDASACRGVQYNGTNWSSRLRNPRRKFLPSRFVLKMVERY